MSRAFRLGQEGVQRQEDHMSKASLICIVSSKLARDTQMDLLKVEVVAQWVKGLLCKPGD